MVKVKERYLKNNFTGSRSGNNSLEILFPTQTLLLKKNLAMKYKIDSSMRALKGENEKKIT